MEGYDIEEVEDHHRHAYRLIYKVRNNRQLFSHLYEKRNMDDDPDLVETVSMLLEAKGYEAGKAYDGVEGEAVAKICSKCFHDD